MRLGKGALHGTGEVRLEPSQEAGTVLPERAQRTQGEEEKGFGQASLRAEEATPEPGSLGTGVRLPPHHVLLFFLCSSGWSRGQGGGKQCWAPEGQPKDQMPLRVGQQKLWDHRATLGAQRRHAITEQLKVDLREG